VAERRAKWVELNKRFSPANLDWSDSQAYIETAYQSILHFYVVPFYYIEYAFAELGSLALWRNFKQNPEKAISDYKECIAPRLHQTYSGFLRNCRSQIRF
jgi:oligoendopeptidase F